MNPTEGQNPPRSGSHSDPVYWLRVADDDYHRGLDLMNQRRLKEAEDALRWSVAMLEVLEGVDDNPAWKLDLQQRLSLAYWRHSLVLQLDGRPEEGLAKVKQGLKVAIKRLDKLQRGTDEHSEATAHTVTLMVDAAAMIDSPQSAERQGLLDEAVRRCGDDPHPCVCDVRASALHNQANCLLLSLIHNPNRPDGDELCRQMENIAHIAGEAIAIRLDLLVESDIVSSWELTCSMLLGAQVLMYCAESEAAVEFLCLASTRLDELGKHGHDLVVKARQLARAMTARAPIEMAVAREKGWLTTLLNSPEPSPESSSERES